MRRGAARAFVIASLFAAGTARADEPSAERIQSAATEFDVGRRAYLAGDYVDAAVHFENAFHDAPRPEPLRSAIRARRAAHDDARAATLASLAAVRYATDAASMDLANETLSELSPRLLGVNLGCRPECGVAADGRIVTLVDSKQVVFYLAPGKHELLVSWPPGRTRRVTVEGPAGAVRDLSLTAPPPPSSSAPPVPVATPAAAPVAQPEASPPSSSPPPHGELLGPAVFVVGAGVTAVGVAATVISGVAAKNDPGAAAVLRDCVGLGESCPTYQRGKSAELRTNILLAGTGAAALLTTVIGVFFTQWSPPQSSAAARIAPYVGSAPTGAYDVGVHGAW